MYIKMEDSIASTTSPTPAVEDVTSEAPTINALPSDLVGLLSGVGTFLLICAFFAIAACVAMCKLRSANSRIQRELNRQADKTAERHSTKIHTDQGVVILLSLDHASMNSTKNGIQNGGYSNPNPDLESSVKAIKHEIASRHFLKNGFHHVIEDELPVKQKLAKVLSTPPILARDASMEEQEESVNVTMLELPEIGMRRSRSLKVEPSRAKREQIHSSPLAIKKQVRSLLRCDVVTYCNAASTLWQYQK